MEKAVKVFAAASVLWFLAGSCANSAGLSEEWTKYSRPQQSPSVKTNKLSASRAKGDALLGFKYEHGLGVPQSFETAAALYERAAEQGDPTGQYLLGLMYNKGHGVWEDTVLAHKWLNLAATHAPPRYREQYLRIRDAVASKMTPDQIYFAQQLAVQWAPRPQPPR
jgi:TPR repeat protein